MNRTKTEVLQLLNEYYRVEEPFQGCLVLFSCAPIDNQLSFQTVTIKE